MPLSITAFKTADSRVSVEWSENETVVAHYRQDAYTPEMLERTDAEPVYVVLAEILTKWDLMGEDGKPYPITEESLKRLPSVFLNTVLRAITEDQAPNQVRLRRANSIS